MPIVEVKVIPRAGCNELIKTEGGFRAKVSALPEDGKANEALACLLSREFDVPKSRIKILCGKSSSYKTVLIESLQNHIK